MSSGSTYYSSGNLAKIHTEWSVVVGQDYRLSDDKFRSEALQFARNIMRKAGNEFEKIASRLANEGYRFAIGGWPIKKLDENISEWVNELRNRNIHMPIVLEAWLIEVGTLNLTGSHPHWSKPAYMFEEFSANTELIFTDAFVVELNPGYIDCLYEEWKSEDLASTRPFRIDFSPDHLHKANLSGGLPYQMYVDRPSIDSIVLNERHCTSFMGLVRTALQWHGFPGLEYIASEGLWSQRGTNLI